MRYKNVCKFCGKEKKLIKAHIIPRKFYLDYKDEQYMSVNKLSGKFQIQQSGAYDKNILCEDCDGKILGKFDQEGYRVLFDEIYKHKLNQLNHDSMYYITSEYYNYEYLRNFFISILWRASVSSLPEFRDINLGIYQGKALEILQGKEKYEKLFKIFIFKYPKDKDFNKILFISKGKFYNRKAFIISLGGYFVTIILNGRNLIFNKQLFPITEMFINNNAFYIVESNELYLRHYYLANKNIREMWEKGFKPPFAQKK
ncbi:MAG: hypothetical protein NC408_03400 [Candidatus Gastranaerophilales bacterium]|nr:hypothetical protein [Candidatus Gastranaerophilales bacterium]MCM1073039.1 hypothetical protein [Bacteroides sp.]